MELRWIRQGFLKLKRDSASIAPGVSEKNDVRRDGCIILSRREDSIANDAKDGLRRPNFEN